VIGPEWEIRGNSLPKPQCEQAQVTTAMLSCCTNAKLEERAVCSSDLPCRHRTPSPMEYVGMKEVEQPAAVLVAALNQSFDGVTDAVVESTQDIVVPKRREREAEPAFVDDFAGSKRAEHAAIEQIGPGASLEPCRAASPICAGRAAQSSHRVLSTNTRTRPTYESSAARWSLQYSENRFPSLPAAIVMSML
jgi:hypothetical protein